MKDYKEKINSINVTSDIIPVGDKRSGFEYAFIKGFNAAKKLMLNSPELKEVYEKYLVYEKELAQKEQQLNKLTALITRLEAENLKLHQDPIRHYRSTLQEKFLSKVSYHENGCWEWIGSKDRKGYGTFVGLGEKRSHRVSYRLFNGDIPSGLFICHHCDNPSCVNPKHLYAGTNQDNMKDKVKRNRGREFYDSLRGEGSPHARLTNEQVREIKELIKVESCEKIARKYNVCATTIEKIKKGKSWTHV